MRALCQVMGDRQIAGGSSQQEPIEPEQAKGKGATHMCERCLKFLPASQAVQAHRMFHSGDSCPSLDENEQQSVPGGAAGCQMAIEAGSGFDEMD